MPSGRFHREVEKLFGLDNYHWVSELMDSNYFFGLIHRILPPHDPLSGLLLYLLTKDPNVLITHVLHNLTDIVNNPSYVDTILKRLVYISRR